MGAGTPRHTERLRILDYDLLDARAICTGGGAAKNVRSVAGDFIVTAGNRVDGSAGIGPSENGDGTSASSPGDFGTIESSIRARFSDEVYQKVGAGGS